jgi:hypothetical protein
MNTIDDSLVRHLQELIASLVDSVALDLVLVLVALVLVHLLLQVEARADNNVLIDVGERWDVQAPQDRDADVEFIKAHNQLPAKVHRLIDDEVALADVGTRPNDLECFEAFAQFGLLFVI